ANGSDKASSRRTTDTRIPLLIRCRCSVAPNGGSIRDCMQRARKGGMAMSDTGPPYIGRSLLRREDRRLLMGQGQFVADLVLPRMLHAVLVRSPVAHARIRAVDLSRAAAAPGVMAALNGADLLQMLPPVAEGQISLPKKWTTVVQHKFLNPRQPLLAHDKVRHVGEAVAIIVAESRYQAE